MIKTNRLLRIFKVTASAQLFVYRYCVNRNYIYMYYIQVDVKFTIHSEASHLLWNRF